MRLDFLLSSTLALHLVACAPEPAPAEVAQPVDASSPAFPDAPPGEDPSIWAEGIAKTLSLRPEGLDRPVVFIGSSSIRRWSTLYEDMAPMEVVNHGFGGSRIHDAIHWLGTLLEGLEPRALVFFSGTNDIAGDRPRDPGYILERFDTLCARAEELGHDVPIFYIAISPTPLRRRHLERVLETNRLIAARCSEHGNLHFIDTASALLDPKGAPDPRWFIDDRIHLNADGYAAWTATIRPALEGALR